MASKTIGTLHTIMSMDSKPFENGINRSNKAMQGFASQSTKLQNTLAGLGKTLFATVGIAGFTLGIKKSLSELDKLGKTASKLGVSTAELSKLQYAGEQTGVALEKMNQSLTIMTKNVGDAARGTGEAKGAIQALGLDINTLSKQTPDQIFKTLATAISRLPDGANKASIAMKIFGESGSDLLNTLNLGAAGLKQYADEAEKLGIVFSESATNKAAEAVDALNRMKLAGESLAKTLTTVLADPIVLIADVLTDTIAAFLSFGKALNTMSGGTIAVVGQLGIVAFAFLALAKAIESIAKKTGNFLSASKSQMTQLNAEQLTVERNTHAWKRNSAERLVATRFTFKNVNGALTLDPAKPSLGGKAVQYLQQDYSVASTKRMAKTAEAIEKSSLTISRAFSSIGRGMGKLLTGFVSILGTFQAVVGSIGAIILSIQQLWTWSQKGAGETIGGKLADRLFGFDEKYYKEGDIRKNQAAIDAYVAAQEAAAEATRQHEEAVKKLHDTLAGMRDSLNDKFTSLLPNADEVRAIEAIYKAFEDAGVGRSIQNNDRDTEIRNTKDAFARLRIATTNKGFEDQVAALQNEAKNVGLTQYQQLIRDLEKAYEEQPKGERGYFGKLILDAKRAQYEIDQYQKKMDDAAKKDQARAEALAKKEKERVDIFSDLSDKYSKLEAIRNGKGLTTASGIGAYQVGSLESYQQTRSARSNNATLESLAREANEISRSMLSTMKSNNITLTQLRNELKNPGVTLP